MSAHVALPALVWQATTSRRDLPGWFGEAEELFRAMGTPFYLGVVLLEQAELLAVAGRADQLEPLRVEAQEIFEQLGATPWLERIAALRVTAAV